MKKLIGIVASFAITVGILSVGFSSATYAVSCGDLTISNTGPGSTNIIECETITEVTVECSNNIIIANANFQDATSGEGEVSGNTGSGSVKTGTAVNYNGTNVTVGAACGETATPVTPVTPTTPTTPTTPGTTTSAATPTAPSVVKPASLPYTANSHVATLMLVATALVAAFVASRIGLAVYRRHTSK